MSEGHTPGPWRIARRGRHRQHISGKGWSEFAKVVVRLSDAGEDDEEGLANARLITAAPELLEAVIAMTDFLEATIKRAGLTDTNGAVADARALIAKATGAA